MSDLIEREAVLDAICGFCKFETDAERRKACTNCLDVKKIKAIPSARPKEGKWIFRGDGKAICVDCGKSYDWDFEAQYYNYCPECGADMRPKGE